eukprot:6246104-Karenia_brevis.AAC.1
MGHNQAQVILIGITQQSYFGVWLLRMGKGGQGKGKVGGESWGPYYTPPYYSRPRPYYPSRPQAQQNQSPFTSITRGFSHCMEEAKNMAEILRIGSVLNSHEA